jgi:Xaa-Pro aminopeptidase
MDTVRIARVREALQTAKLDALVATTAANVLMLTGYWPVVGASIAVCTREGAVALIVPADELRFARQSWADCIESFDSGSLEELCSLHERWPAPLRRACRTIGINSGDSLGIEGSATFDPATY